MLKTEYIYVSCQAHTVDFNVMLQIYEGQIGVEANDAPTYLYLSVCKD